MDLKNAIFYNILIDRFSRGKELDKGNWVCDGPSFCGGNLKGITERLDYLKDLGVDILLLTPFNKGIEYHGYHITDLLSVDPRFGSLEDLKNLISEAHKKGMKIIMDWTLNHVSWNHPYFVEALQGENSEYRKWFHFYKSSDKYNYLCFLDVVTLPKLRLEYPLVKEYIYKVTRFWLSQGVDGMRLDHVIGISHDFWKDFSGFIRKEFPGTILIGEAVKQEIGQIELPTLKIKHKYLTYLLSVLGLNPTTILMRQYVKYFDAMLDFRFRDIVIEQIARKKCLNTFFAKLLLALHYKIFPKGYPLVSITDNHDFNRLIFECDYNWDKFKQIVKLQMEQNNPASIFYGTEAGLSQDRARTREEYSDIDIRRPMPWNNINQEILNFYKQLIFERKEGNKK